MKGENLRLPRKTQTVSYLINLVDFHVSASTGLTMVLKIINNDYHRATFEMTFASSNYLSRHSSNMGSN